jgi:hypothetical protein
VLTQIAITIVVTPCRAEGWGCLGQGLLLGFVAAAASVVAAWPTLYLLRVRPAWPEALIGPIALGGLGWMTIDGLGQGWTLLPVVSSLAPLWRDQRSDAGLQRWYARAGVPLMASDLSDYMIADPAPNESEHEFRYKHPLASPVVLHNLTLEALGTGGRLGALDSRFVDHAGRFTRPWSRPPWPWSGSRRRQVEPGSWPLRRARRRRAWSWWAPLAGRSIGGRRHGAAATAPRRQASCHRAHYPGWPARKPASGNCNPPAGGAGDVACRDPSDLAQGR